MVHITTLYRILLDNINEISRTFAKMVHTIKNSKLPSKTNQFFISNESFTFDSQQANRETNKYARKSRNSTVQKMLITD